MNGTIEELYDRKVYSVEVAVKVEVIGSVSVANRWMLGWPARVTALLRAGTYLPSGYLEKLEPPSLDEAKAWATRT